MWTNLPMSLRALFPVIIAATLSLCGCDARKKTAQPAPDVTAYEARGVLHEIRGGGRRAVIAHEAIPGYMEAMTMEFDVADAKEIAGLVPGDTLAFRLCVNESAGWIDRVRRTGHTDPPPVAKDGALPEAGAALPECALIDQRGEARRTGEFRGRALAITFIYTRCPFPNFCPLLSSRFAEVQRQMAADASDGWHLLSVTIDPQHDTPERLGEYARRFSADAAHWSFATGDAGEIEKLTGFFGLRIIREGGEWNHTLRTAVIDRTGRVRKIFTGNEWTTEELTAELRQASGVPR